MVSLRIHGIIGFRATAAASVGRGVITGIRPYARYHRPPRDSVLKRSRVACDTLTN
eukprot:COSAG02_NODE_39827_length_412_cov_1.076677_1_plen_55_part_01